MDIGRFVIGQRRQLVGHSCYEVQRVGSVMLKMTQVLQAGVHQLRKRVG